MKKAAPAKKTLAPPTKEKATRSKSPASGSTKSKSPVAKKEVTKKLPVPKVVETKVPMKKKMGGGMSMGLATKPFDNKVTVDKDQEEILKMIKMEAKQLRKVNPETPAPAEVKEESKTETGPSE